MTAKKQNHNLKSTSTVPSKFTKNSSEKLKVRDILKSYEEVPNISELVAETRVDPFAAVPKPPSIIEVEGVPLFTRGNFSCIFGKPKSRKTFYAMKLVLTVLDNNSRLFKGFKNKTPHTNVFFFDTEQGNWHVHLFGNRVVKKMELTKETSCFHIYGLRGCSPHERLQIIEYELYAAKRLGIVIIDGIADLFVKGTNDDAESSLIANKLLKWTYELDAHIVVILHENKTNGQIKGHAGSRIIEKAETVLNVKRLSKDDSISVITSEFNRGLDIPDDYMAIDENGIPVDVDVPMTTSSPESLKNPSDFDYKFKLELIEQVFADVSELKYKQLIDKMKYHFAESGHNIGDGKLNDWKTYYLERGIINQEREKMPYTLNTKFIQSERNKLES